MATYTRTQISDSNSNNSPPALPSVDIGSVIVRSLQQVIEATNGNEVTESDLSGKITKGINDSDLVKNDKSGDSNSPSNPLNKLLVDNDKKGQIEKKKSYDKHLEKLLKDEEKARSKRELAIEKAVDSTLRGINTFAQNPLKGLNNAIEFGIKGIFKVTDKLMNKTMGEIGSDIKKGAKTALMPITETGKLVKGAGVGIATVANLVKGKDKNVEVKNAKEAEVLTADELKKVITEGVDESDVADENGSDKDSGNKDGGSKQEEDKRNAKEANIEKKRDGQANEQLAAVKGTNLTLGLVLMKIGAVAIAVTAALVLFPILVAKVTDLLIRVKEGFRDIKVKVPILIDKFTAKLKAGAYALFAQLRVPGIGYLMKGNATSADLSRRDDLKEKRDELMAKLGPSEKDVKNKNKSLDKMIKQGGFDRDLLLNTELSEDELIEKLKEDYANKHKGHGVVGDKAVKSWRENIRNIRKGLKSDISPEEAEKINAQIASIDTEISAIDEKRFGPDAVYSEDKMKDKEIARWTEALKGRKYDQYEFLQIYDNTDDPVKKAALEDWAKNNKFEPLKESSLRAMKGHTVGESAANVGRQAKQDFIDDSKKDVTERKYTESALKERIQNIQNNTVIHVDNSAPM